MDGKSQGGANLKPGDYSMRQFFARCFSFLRLPNCPHLPQAYVISACLRAAFTPEDASQLLGALASLRCRNDLLVDVLPLLVKAVADAHQSAGGRTLSRTLGAVTVLLRRLEGKAVGGVDIPAEWGGIRGELVPTVSALQPAVLRVARQCLEHSCLPEETPGVTATWKKKLGGAAAASAEAEKEHKLDLFLLLQVSVAIPPLCFSFPQWPSL